MALAGFNDITLESITSGQDKGLLLGKTSYFELARMTKDARAMRIAFTDLSRSFYGGFFAGGCHKGPVDADLIWSNMHGDAFDKELFMKTLGGMVKQPRWLYADNDRKERSATGVANSLSRLVVQEKEALWILHEVLSGGNGVKLSVCDSKYTVVLASANTEKPKVTDNAKRKKEIIKALKPLHNSLGIWDYKREVLKVDSSEETPYLESFKDDKATGYACDIRGLLDTPQVLYLQRLDRDKIRGFLRDMLTRMDDIDALIALHTPRYLANDNERRDAIIMQIVEDAPLYACREESRESTLAKVVLENGVTWPEIKRMLDAWDKE